MMRDHALYEVDVSVAGEGNIHPCMHLLIDGVERSAGRAAVATQAIGAVPGTSACRFPVAGAFLPAAGLGAVFMPGALTAFMAVHFLMNLVMHLLVHLIVHHGLMATVLRMLLRVVHLRISRR
jgi:hypothetical protein